MTIYGEKITTKCGESGINAFYCSADQQVYYSNQLPTVLESASENKWTADVVMAHEFGHAIQGRTGILISAHALGQNSGDQATDLQYTRRLETQADCFSGMFVRAVSVSLGVQRRTPTASWRSTSPSVTTRCPVIRRSSATTASPGRGSTGAPPA